MRRPPAGGYSRPVQGRQLQTPLRQTPPALVKKIGKTTYRVRVHFSTTSTETMEDKIKRLLREEVRQAMENE